MNDFEIIQPERVKLSRVLVSNARVAMMVFILFTVIVVTTTDVRFMTKSDWRDLGLEFFILLFCSYGMYVCCMDGGVKKGYSSENYNTCLNRFRDLKEKVENTMLTQMGEFCVHYCDEELRKARMQYLAVVCIPYEEYMEKYVKLGKSEIVKITELTTAQKKAVIKANSIKRIKLTPEMIMTQGRAGHARSPLAFSPDKMKYIALSAKIAKMSFVTIFVTLIALDPLLDPSWNVFVKACLKLVSVIINGFDGHKDGLENVNVFTVNYMNNQSSLMQQALQYAKVTTTND